ncbi:hypothetical protein C448_11641 [Halococcus morrhuae DSM 1307]|uniref:DUF8055 domain-containing protein n=1 Tax=Halococcus morrhuae DSM 1307 TaxID=931277 RepID=M0M8W5_HALMO|nr:hypothetical protein [Halococcus morrhuae]EMA42181.1 hypothetical protein C448_11641 [Halococcus morrhuae DSM 1307]
MARPEPEYRERIDELAARAARDRATFEPPENPPDEERAMAFLREGLGPLVVLYLDARTADQGVAFSGDELAQFHRATNDWLALYARCYGVAMEPDATIRKAAEVLIQTDDIQATAQLLTQVPPRPTG